MSLLPSEGSSKHITIHGIVFTRGLELKMRVNLYHRAEYDQGLTLLESHLKTVSCNCLSTSKILNNMLERDVHMSSKDISFFSQSSKLFMGRMTSL